MERITTIGQMQKWSENCRREGSRVICVPTMGALHQGHVSLVRQAQSMGDKVVGTIFVNPTQFGPKDDYERYPRTVEKDCEKLKEAGAAAVFTPSVDEMYPRPALTRIVVDQLFETMEGKSRPGHLEGVALVVMKLFMAVLPHAAVFGQKDIQQALMLRRLVSDLNMGLTIEIAPTVRESDGLAMSSRNRYISEEERPQAREIYLALKSAREEIERGERSAAKLVTDVHSRLSSTAGMSVEYVEAVDENTFSRVKTVEPGTFVAVAAKLGSTRLIDNLWYRTEGLLEL